MEGLLRAQSTSSHHGFNVYCPLIGGEPPRHVTEPYGNLASREMGEFTSSMIIGVCLRDIYQLVAYCATISYNDIIYLSSIGVWVDLDLHCSLPG